MFDLFLISITDNGTKQMLHELLGMDAVKLLSSKARAVTGMGHFQYVSGRREGQVTDGSVGCLLSGDHLSCILSNCQVFFSSQK